MPNFSDSNRTNLRYVEEGSWASSTVANPNMQNINLTSESLKSNINTVTSETIRSDRNVSDITTVGGGAGGDLSFELRYSEYDDLLQGGFFSTWITTNVSAAVASANFSGAVISVDSSALVDAEIGHFFRVANASATANDGDYRVTAVSTTSSATRITLADASSGSAASFSSDVFATGTTLKGNNIRNGTTNRSYLFEKEFADVSSYQQYPGCRVASFALEFATQAILTGTMSLMGKTQTADVTSIASVTTAVNTNPVLNASGNVARVWEGGQAVTGIVFQSISLSMTNNLRDQLQVGSASLAGIGTGRCEVTGSLTAYFEDNTLLNKFTGDTGTNLRLQIDDDNGNSYILDLPNVKLTEATIAAGGGNADIVQELSFGAVVDSTGTYAIQLTALPA